MIMKVYRRIIMSKKIMFYLAAIGFCFLMTGCENAINPYLTKENMKKGLDSCLMKLTKSQLVMKASVPTEKVKIDDGEIWIYKYRKSDMMPTTKAADGLLAPNVSESKSYDYALDMRMQFNNKGVLTEWSYKGNIDAFEHPFKNVGCQ